MLRETCCSPRPFAIHALNSKQTKLTLLLLAMMTTATIWRRRRFCKNKKNVMQKSKAAQ
jgi:hypothetical protein